MPCRICGRLWRIAPISRFWQNQPTWRRRRVSDIGRAHSLDSHPTWLAGNCASNSTHVLQREQFNDDSESPPRTRLPAAARVAAWVCLSAHFACRSMCEPRRIVCAPPLRPHPLRSARKLGVAVCPGGAGSALLARSNARQPAFCVPMLRVPACARRQLGVIPLACCGQDRLCPSPAKPPPRRRFLPLSSGAKSPHGTSLNASSMTFNPRVACRLPGRFRSSLQAPSTAACTLCVSIVKQHAHLPTT